VVEEKKEESKEDVRHFHVMGEGASPCKQYPRPLQLAFPIIIIIIIIIIR